MPYFVHVLVPVIVNVNFSYTSYLIIFIISLF